MDPSARAVGRIGRGGTWVGFARGAEGGHALAMGIEDGSLTVRADADLLLCLAVAYFAEGLEEPPDDLAATHSDIADLVRRLAADEADLDRRRALAASVDAIDDGLGPEVVISWLASAIRGPAAADPVAHLRDRVRKLAGES